MINQILKSLIIFLLFLHGCALRSDKPSRIDYFGVHDFDEAVIDFYYPDTVISPKDYQDTYYELCYLEKEDLGRYFKLLETNDYSA